MTIIEVQNEKIESLKEYAKMICKHGRKLLECLEEIDELSEDRYMEAYGQRRKKMHDKECEEYERYY